MGRDKARRCGSLLGVCGLAALLLSVMVPAGQARAAPEAAVADAPGAKSDTALWRAEHRVLLGVARAGSRLVAVGDRGTVLLSDDSGQTWRMGKSGTDQLLTAVLFVSPTEGWAVGQGEIILHSTDAGESWTTQRVTAGADRNGFSIASFGDHHLVVAGAYALALETEDGGEHWTEIKLPQTDEDYHLSCALARGSDLLLTGESGHAFLRQGANWTPIPLPYDGSQFGCLPGPDNALYSFGLRGSLFRLDMGATKWTRITTNEGRSLFGGTVLASGKFALVGANGLMATFDPVSGVLHEWPAVTDASLSGVSEIAEGKWVVVGDDGMHIVDIGAPAASGAMR